MTDFEYPWVTIGQIHPLFGYPCRRSAVRAIREGRFPIPTFKLHSRKIVADREVVHEYFRLQGDAGTQQLGGGSGPRPVELLQPSLC